MSIRTKLAVAVAVVLTATIVLLGVAFVRGTRDTLVDQIDAQVLASAARNRPPRNDGRDGGPRDDGGPAAAATPAAGTPVAAADGTTTDVRFNAVARFVYDDTGALVVDDPAGFTDDPTSPPVVPDPLGPGITPLLGRIVTVPARDGTLDYRMLVQRGSGGETLVTAAPLQSVDAALRDLIQTLVLVGVVALVVAVAACWWLIRHGLRPVDRMIDTAAAIAGGDLGRRVEDADPRTELGRLGGALNEMLTQIESALEARTESEARLRRFVADAAHELRTPLTSLRGYAELYRQGMLPDEAGVANAMGRIEAEGGRMARLVDDLLLLARVDQQRGVERKPMDLSPLVAEAAADFRAVDPERPLTVDLPETAPVSGDRLRLRQVVDNLLTNARVHTPAGTPVHLAVRVDDGAVELTVADEGPGIAPEDQARIFERFWRADRARARRTGGSGLGLAIVQALVEAHDGTVAVRSEHGAGAAFTVRLPLLTPAA